MRIQFLGDIQTWIGQLLDWADRHQGSVSIIAIILTLGLFLWEQRNVRKANQARITEPRDIAANLIAELERDYKKFKELTKEIKKGMAQPFPSEITAEQSADLSNKVANHFEIVEAIITTGPPSSGLLENLVILKRFLHIYKLQGPNPQNWPDRIKNLMDIREKILKAK